MALSLFIFFILASLCFSVSQPLCHTSERSLLLQFKENLTIDAFASSPLGHPKTDSWTQEGSEASDCCLWDGIECDEDTGFVIGLDLSSSFLFGPISSNSSIFSLVHLESLNLADNNFNYSRIPSSIKHLSKLKYLNLSASLFWGQIPYEVASLSSLSSLDLSQNFYENSRLLELRSPDFDSLIRNLTSLKQLHLSYVRIASQVPDSLASFASLESLDLKSCGLKDILLCFICYGEGFDRERQRRLDCEIERRPVVVVVAAVGTSNPLETLWEHQQMYALDWRY